MIKQPRASRDSAATNAKEDRAVTYYSGCPWAFHAGIDDLALKYFEMVERCSLKEHENLANPGWSM